MNDPSQNPPAASHLAAFNKSFAVFIETARAYPRAIVREKPSEKAFSATEIVYHMLDVERLWQQRIRGLLDGSMTQFQQMDPDKEARDQRYNEKPYDSGIEQLIEARHETETLVRGLSEDQMSLTGTHTRFGEMNIYNILETMEGHDRQHAAQLERTAEKISDLHETL